MALRTKRRTNLKGSLPAASGLLAVVHRELLDGIEPEEEGHLMHGPLTLGLSVSSDTDRRLLYALSVERTLMPSYPAQSDHLKDVLLMGLPAVSVGEGLIEIEGLVLPKYRPHRCSADSVRQGVCGLQQVKSPLDGQHGFQGVPSAVTGPFSRPLGVHLSEQSLKVGVGHFGLERPGLKKARARRGIAGLVGGTTLTGHSYTSTRGLATEVADFTGKLRFLTTLLTPQTPTR